MMGTPVHPFTYVGSGLSYPQTTHIEYMESFTSDTIKILCAMEYACCQCLFDTYLSLCKTADMFPHDISTQPL